MISNQVLPIQLAWLLVAMPMVFKVSANAYIQHDDGYYDQENNYHSSDENIIEDDHHKPAAYSYQYQVHSPQTGDYKTQHEERIGDTVRGSYSLIEPDGTRRIVEYTADPQHGFKAVVKREPLTGHLQQHSPPIEVIQPKPITKPPPIPRPTPIKPSYPVRNKYPPKLFHTVPQPVYYYTTAAPKPKNVPNKYSLFRFHGWPFMH